MRLIVVPSNLVAFAVPETVETSPIERTALSVAWAYCPLARGPASDLTREPFKSKPFSVSNDGNSKLVK